MNKIMPATDQHVTTEEKPPTNQSRWFVICGVFAAVIAIVGFMMHFQFFHDDAYITLRYSQNWLDGNGVNWNTGERVEGYTSFLHLALVSLLGLFQVDLVSASRMLGIACYGGICWLAFFHSCFSSISCYTSMQSCL